MNNLPYILAAIVAFAGGIILVVTIVDWLFLRRKEKQIRQEEQLHIPASDVLLDAHQKAKKIIEKAVDQAEGTLINSTLVKEEMVKELTDALKKVSEETIISFRDETKQFDAQYKVLFDHLQKEYEKKAQETLSVIQQSVQVEMQDFQTILKKETVSVQQLVAQKIQEEFATVQKEIANYRVSKYKEVDQNVEKILMDLTQDMLGKSLTKEDHGKLIIDSLEKAKNEGMFN